MRKKFGKLESAFTVRFELPLSPEQLGVLLNKGEPLAFDVRLRDDLAGQFLKLRLVIKEFQVARTSGHEEVDHVLRSRRMMAVLRRQRVGLPRINPVSLRGEQPLLVQQRSQPEAANRKTSVAEKVPASLLDDWVDWSVHRVCPT